MSPKLKPLLLPQLVEERKKLELQQTNDGENTYVFYTYNSSSSDLASPSPVTPTFSRAGHSRFSGSVSSLEIPTHSCSESPASPGPVPQPPHVNKTTKPQLPDVQEEPLEREEEGTIAMPDFSDHEAGLYDCLCDTPCAHHGNLVQSATLESCMASDFDYDLGFLSDSDFNASPRHKKRRHGSDASFSRWSTKLGSKLQGWRSPSISSISRRYNPAFSPASDPSLADQRPSFSREPSSRSSSISAPGRGAPDRQQDPALPATPALSLYESSESVAISSPLVKKPSTLGKSLERERATATTPLLPPLLTDTSCHTQPQSLQASPLQSPSVVPSPNPDISAFKSYPTPPLSTKASVSSFRRGTVTSIFGDAPSPVPCFFDHQDSWSHRLGHANFTIEPKPYLPETADIAALQALRTDWSLARTNYAKHLVRTGEHYGATSKTYALTEAKWAEVEQEWKRNEADLIQRLDRESLTSPELHRTAEDTPPSAIPRMLSDDGKFPELGDVEIVGPMVRDAVMARDGQDEKRNSASTWLRSLAGKVGLRK
ncbi:hypothetical protein N656DRAFT_793345 [Canariomyces notabilis]|uniref:Only prolin and serin are matching in the corresponding protein n=1 Tax=Canariomyces notabilis TaxID=2074819 RepID=A0AAN6QBK6_9PEZI|nr:hypothetical protein N656DRAFT_793345 [Canariomyces arenarius]